MKKFNHHSRWLAVALVVAAAWLVLMEPASLGAEARSASEEIQAALASLTARSAANAANAAHRKLTTQLPPASGRTVIVVGSGLAGMSATVEALQAGARVYLVEKTQRLGGNSEKASSGINGAKTAAQAKLWLKDSVAEFYADTIASGKGLCNTTLVEVLANQSAAAHDFLTFFGVDLSSVTKLGGHSRARTHAQTHNPDAMPRTIGSEIIGKLNSYLQTVSQERLTILKLCRLTDLLVENGSVVGIRYSKTFHDSMGQPSHEAIEELRGDSVVLATGGYSRAEDLLRKYTPDIVDLPTTNGPFAAGEGIKVAEKVGASVIHMDQVQIHPTSFIMPDDPLAKTKFLAPEALRGLGGILINQEGKRFVNELDTRDKVTNAIFKNCKPMKVVKDVDGEKKKVDGPVMAYLILIDEALKQYPPIKFYQAKGFVTAYSGLESLAIGLKVPYHNLEKTLADYNECFDRKGVNCPEQFGKKDFAYPTRDNDMYHVMMITPAIHYTMGGLEIDQDSRVLRVITSNVTDEEGITREVITKEHIPGLFAAGEVTGGVHGGNRLGGNSLLECVVFGRIAGKEASRVSAEIMETSEEQVGAEDSEGMRDEL